MRTGGGIKLGLAPTRELLEALGRPQDRIPHCVVIAGTNGKGSTAMLVAMALEQAGLRAGLYTSPHVMRYTERIQINRQEISPNQVVAGLARIRRAEGALSRPATFFEATTALALDHFAEQEVQVAVLEVGLGGRLDSTNVVDRTVAAITRVGLDHQHILGSTLEAITREKAGVMQAQRPVVVGEQRPEVAAVLHQRAREVGARLTEAAPWTSPHPLAAYQASNLAVAAAVLAELAAAKVPVRREHLLAALPHFAWRGRFAWRGENLVLDAAHNRDGVQVLLQALEGHPRGRRPRPVHVVFSALRDKEGPLLASLLRQRATQLYLAPLPLRRGHTAHTVGELDPLGVPCTSVPHALARAQAAAAQDGGLVVVAGSIFLVAEALGALGEGPRDPPIPF